MESSKIKVSVIMPVYNSGIYLKTAVESILAQSLREIEVILVDDGSTDGSSELCDEYAKRDDRVRVIHQKNGGICNARNTALKIVRGEYVGFSDHDDEFSKDAFEKAYNFGARHDLDMVKFGHKTIKTNGKAVLKELKFDYAERIYSEKESLLHYLQMLHAGQMECVWDSLYRKEFIDRNHLQLNTDFKAGGEDIDFNGRVLNKEPRIGIMPGMYYFHYIRVGFSTSTKFNEVNIKNALSFPNRLNDYMSSCDFDKIYQDNKELYAETIIRRTVGSLLFSTSTPACTYSDAQIIELLEQLRNNPAIMPYFWEASIIKMLSRNLKYGLLYWAFTNRNYGLCMRLYNLRNKRDKVKSNETISTIVNKIKIGGVKN